MWTHDWLLRRQSRCCDCGHKVGAVKMRLEHNNAFRSAQRSLRGRVRREAAAPSVVIAMIVARRTRHLRSKTRTVVVELLYFWRSRLHSERDGMGDEDE